MKKIIDLSPETVTALKHKAADENMPVKIWIQNLLNDHAAGNYQSCVNFKYPELEVETLTGELKRDVLYLLLKLKPYTTNERIYVLNTFKDNSIKLFTDHITSTVLLELTQFCMIKEYNYWISARCVNGKLYTEFSLYK